MLRIEFTYILTIVITWETGYKNHIFKIGKKSFSKNKKISLDNPTKHNIA